MNLAKNSKILQEASFDPAVRKYWMLNGILVCVLTVIGIPLLILYIPLALLFTGKYLDSHSCILTKKALLVNMGIFTKVDKSIPLTKITDIGMVQGPIMRRFGLHRLSIETAGQSQQGVLLSLIGVKGCHSVSRAHPPAAGCD